MALSDAQHDRLILRAALKDLLELAEFYHSAQTNLPIDVQDEKATYFSLEAARVSLRLAAVQKYIEDHDLD